MQRVRRIWNDFFFSGVSGESLGLLRICFASGLLFYHVTQFYTLLQLDPGGAHFFYYEPMWYFELLGIERYVPLLGFGVFALLMASTVSMALGFKTRTSIFTVIVCIFYLKGARDGFSGDVHHRYLVPMQILLMLLLSRCGDAHSLDERRRSVKSQVSEWQASWPIKAMQLYTVSFYFWSGAAKLRVTGWDWVADGTRIQQLLIGRSVLFGVDASGDPISNPLGWFIAQYPTLCFLLGISTLVMEFGFPLLLLLKSVRARLIFLCAVGFFHVVNFFVAYVGFVLFPIMFLIFFDLEKARRRFR